MLDHFAFKKSGLDQIFVSPPSLEVSHHDTYDTTGKIACQDTFQKNFEKKSKKVSTFYFFLTLYGTACAIIKAKGGEIMNSMADRIRWLRKEKCHKTQEEVGKYVGVGKAAIQKYESGLVTNIPPDKVELLAEALDTTPGFIMGWEPDPDKFRLDARFGQLLKKERESLNMSPSDFAAYIGISEDALARYESGSSIPSINVALPIAVQLGISIDQYDPLEKPKVSDLDKEIILLLSSLSVEKKLMALAYIQGLKDTEDRKASPPSDPPSTRPTVP